MHVCASSIVMLGQFYSQRSCIFLFQKSCCRQLQPGQYLLGLALSIRERSTSPSQMVLGLITRQLLSRLTREPTSCMAEAIHPAVRVEPQYLTLAIAFCERHSSLELCQQQVSCTPSEAKMYGRRGQDCSLLVVGTPCTLLRRPTFYPIS